MSTQLETAITIGEARPDGAVRGERVLKAVEAAVSRVDRAIGSVLPASLNPLAQTGAIANTTFLVAGATGVLLLLWYVPSVHQAFDSLEAMHPLTGGLVRSLHRYSSDACMLFVLLHATQLFLARRFTGARWVAWVTGIALLGTLWFVGWLGYWLVWDERAHLVALGTARLLDDLPIFAEPLSRSFLSDEGVNSLLFFMVFFMHMLVPLVMGIGLWLHITRLSRARFLTGRAMTWWVMGALVLVSLIWPAESAPAARMTVLPEAMTVDAWYLLPLTLTERLGAGALWAIVLVSGVVLFSLPRVLRREARPPPAVVDVARCNGCTLCYEDCPYDAIRMVPRTDGRNYPSVAEIDPDKCVSCGICAGSCNPGSIGLLSLPVLDARRTVEGWVEEELNRGGSPRLAFVCSSSAGRGFKVDPQTGTCADLPDYRVLPVPCTGWVHALTIERAIKRGAAGVLMVSCGHGEVTFREGANWTELRLAGERAPAFRSDKAEAHKIRTLRCEPSAVPHLVEEAKAFARDGASSRRAGPRSKGLRAAAGVAIAASLAGAMYLGSDIVYSSPARPPAELVVSFRHPGKSGESCRKLTPEEIAALPVHMRRDEVCERGRSSVRLQVVVDGETVLAGSYTARGLSGDGNSVAVESIVIEPGVHEIEVALGETSDPDEWTYRARRTVEFPLRSRRVVLFDRSAGFSWHGDGDGARVEVRPTAGAAAASGSHGS